MRAGLVRPPAGLRTQRRDMTAISFEMSARLAEARIAYLDVRLADAERALREVLTQYPNNPEALYLLGAISYRAGQHDSCVRMMQRVVALKPRHHDAHLTLGMSFRALKRPLEARQALKKAVSLKPGSLDARFNLALSDIDAGDLPSAVKHLERAVKIDPDAAHVRNTYAGVLFQTGDREESLRQLRRAAALTPDSPDMQQNLGMALQRSGQHEEAAAQFRRVLALAPKHLDAMYGLANTLTEIRQLDEAYANYEKFLSAQPKVGPARSNYGLALRHGNRSHDAVEQFRQALELSRDEPMAAGSLAEALALAGRADEAASVLRASIESRPTDGATLQLADLLARLGKFAEAAVLFERLLKRNPDNPFVLVGLADIRPHDFAKAHEDRLLALGTNDKRAPGERVRSNLALARLYDQRSDFGRAFAHMETANKLRQRYLPFEMGEFRNWINRLIAAFSPAAMAATHGISIDSPLPVFVAGLHRSGAVLAERMIAAHPQGYGLGDVQDLYTWARRLPALIGSKHEYPDCMGELGASTGKRVATELVTLRQRHAPHAVRVADKSGMHWQLLGLANFLVPRAPIVHITREPMDVLLSIYGHHLPGEHPYPSDLAALGHFWREYRRLMDHWRTMLPMTEVKYEELVAMPGPSARALLQGVGLPWDATVLRFAESKQPVATASSWRVRQPLTTERVGRWKNYAEFLTPLREALEK